MHLLCALVGLQLAQYIFWRRLLMNCLSHALYNIRAHAPQHLQEKCSIVFRGDTRDVLILRLTHLALHGPNCSASLSLSVQVICGIHDTGWFELMMMMTKVMNKIIKKNLDDRITQFLEV